MHKHHSIDYIEFSVTDMSATKNFFNKAFGWSFNEYGPDYTGIVSLEGKGEIGGLTKVDHLTTGSPLVVLYSKDLNESLNKVKEAGGLIKKDIFSFPGGQRFEFTEPSGNLLAVWSDQ